MVDEFFYHDIHLNDTVDPNDETSTVDFQFGTAGNCRNIVSGLKTVLWPMDCEIPLQHTDETRKMQHLKIWCSGDIAKMPFSLDVFANVTNLILACCEFRTDTVSRFLSALHQLPCPNVVHLTIINWTVLQLALDISNLQKLETLELANCAITQDSAASIGAHEPLRVLTLTSNFSVCTIDSATPDEPFRCLIRSLCARKEKLQTLFLINLLLNEFDWWFYEFMTPYLAADQIASCVFMMASIKPFYLYHRTGSNVVTITGMNTAYFQYKLDDSSMVKFKNTIDQLASSSTLRMLVLFDCKRQMRNDFKCNFIDCIKHALKKNESLFTFDLNEGGLIVSGSNALESNPFCSEVCSDSSPDTIYSMPSTIVQRNKAIQAAHFMLSVTLVFFSFNPPAYVLLWIFDWLPIVHDNIKHIRKINFLQSVVESCRRVYIKRETKASRKHQLK